MQNLAIDAARLWDSLQETARFGACAGGGVSRLTLSDDDKAVRDWFKAAAQALGCSVTIDAVGNMFAHRPGKHNDLPPIAMGSHLDTQPAGGKFDGNLGVLAGLEVLRTLENAGYVTNAPLELINWTNEEGARFALAMLASGVFAGVFTPEQAGQKRDRDGVTFEEALVRIGYKGPEIPGSHRLGAYFELHIEQGPILEAEKITIGVVTGGQAGRWFDVALKGESGHTGATPMHLRKNALLGAARLVLAVDEIAWRHSSEAVGTVGQLDVTPNSRNVIPGEVFLTVDLRHPSETTLDRMEAAFKAALAEIAGEFGLAFEVTQVWDLPAVKFNPELVACVEAGAEKAGYSSRHIVAGAGHDACYIARVAPATMIFVPSLGGISHNVTEFTSREDCAAGAQVLLNAVLAYDDAVNGSASAQGLKSGTPAR